MHENYLWIYVELARRSKEKGGREASSSEEGKALLSKKKRQRSIFQESIIKWWLHWIFTDLQILAFFTITGNLSSIIYFGAVWYINGHNKPGLKVVSIRRVGLAGGTYAVNTALLDTMWNLNITNWCYAF